MVGGQCGAGPRRHPARRQHGRRRLRFPSERDAALRVPRRQLRVDRRRRFPRRHLVLGVAQRLDLRPRRQREAQVVRSHGKLRRRVAGPRERRNAVRCLFRRQGLRDQPTDRRRRVDLPDGGRHLQLPRARERCQWAHHRSDRGFYRRLRLLVEPFRAPQLAVRHGGCRPLLTRHRPGADR